MLVMSFAIRRRTFATELILFLVGKAEIEWMLGPGASSRNRFDRLFQGRHFIIDNTTMRHACGSREIVDGGASTIHRVIAPEQGRMPIESLKRTREGTEGEHYAV